MKYLMLLVFFSSVSLAGGDEIVKCTRADGSVVYTNTGCENGKAEVVLSRPITIIESPRSPLMDRVAIDATLKPWQWVLVIYLLMSVVCFLVYRLDKRRAIQRQRRIPETWLHGLELFGGWLGALVAQRTLRHKNQKKSYRIVFWLIVVLHVLAWEDYLSGHLLWDLARGEKPADIKQRVLETVLEKSGSTTAVSQEEIEQGIKRILAEPGKEGDIDEALKSIESR